MLPSSPTLRVPDLTCGSIFAVLLFLSGVANLEHRDVDEFVLARVGGSAGCRRAATLKLLDAKRNPLFLDIDVEHDSLDRLALVVKIEIGRASCRERVCQYV